MRSMKRLYSMGVFTIIAALLFTLVGGSFAAAQDQRLTWSIDARITIPAHELATRGVARARAELVDPLASGLSSVEVRENYVGSDEASYTVRGSRSGTVDEFRRHFHSTLKSRMRELGGDTEMQITSRGLQGSSTDVVVAATPSTGYVWTVAGDSEFTEAAPSDFVMHSRGAGASQHQILHLKNDRNRSGAIKLVYRRPWEPVRTTAQVMLDLDALPARLDLSDPTVPATSVAPPARTAATTTAFPAVAATALPAALDWRTSGVVTPIRDQGSCGSCWAFGTVGIMESALWKSGTANVDLSEQYLVSCNNDGWNCDTGGWTAHKYHYNTLGKSQSAIGAVLESTKPYTGTNGSCTTALSHPYKLSSWQFIVATETTMPTVDQIKAALYTYGPITAGVCAGTGWDTYTGGIFTTDETSQCGGGTNHQIILVGWDDNGGTNGYWILRNSWGTSWGIGGYMYIAYDKSRVGEGTSWVATSAVVAAPTVTSISPTSLIQGATAQTVTISGTNLTGATLSVSGTGVTFGTATASATQITVPVTVAATAALGTRTITVTTSGGSATTALTVTAAVVSAPTITSISPASLIQGTTAQTVTITGTNLTGATLSVSGTGVTFGSATISASQITVPLTVAATAAVGVRTLVVTTTGGSASASATLMITAPVLSAPIITSISPASLIQGATAQAVTISGTNLTGATLSISGTGVSFGTATASATSITVPITVVATASVGPRTITVTTTGGSATATLTVIVATGATTLFSDGFEGPGWATKQVSGRDGAWTLVTSGQYPNARPHGGGKMADFNSFTSISGKTRIYYATGLAIPASATAVSLKYWMFHDTDYQYFLDRVQPQVSTDGITWINVGSVIYRNDGTNGWAQATVDLSAYKGKTIYLGFLGISDYGNDIYLDDVSVMAQ